MIKEIEQYFDNLTVGKGKSKHTIRTYDLTLRKLTEYFKIESLEQLNSIDENQYISFYRAECGNGNTLNTHIRNLSAFFHWLYNDDYKNYPFSKVKLGASKLDKVNRKMRSILTKEESELAIQAGSNLQEKFMMALMLKTALRRSEITNIKLTDISGCEIVITSKGGDQAKTYLNDRLCGMLSDYLSKERNTDSEYLFYGKRGASGAGGKLNEATVNTRFQNCVKRAGIDKKVTAHTARRTAITRAAIQRSPFAAQMLGRHKNMKTTMDAYVFADDEFVKEMLMENE
jgi:site-specific recombinase XerD